MCCKIEAKGYQSDWGYGNGKSKHINCYVFSMNLFILLLLPLFNLILQSIFQVRNSVGANCYVSDEIITSRHGVRLRVGNTDAEVLIFYMNIIDNKMKICIS